MEFIPAKTLISAKKDTSWFGIDYNMNIYKGCNHGCIYCDSRSECYRIDHFDTVRAKENALSIIENELRRKVKHGVIGTGSMSDPYNPCERVHELTRQALGLVNQYQYGISIATKSNLIERDADVLQQIKKHSPVLCKITITSYDDALSQKIEPNVAPSSHRFAAIEKLSDVGIFTGVLMLPILPYLTDTTDNIKSIINKAHACGAKFIYPYFGVTLRQNQRDWYFDKLEEKFPHLNLSQAYRQRYGYAYNCQSPKLKELKKVFTEECSRLGLLYHMNDIIHAYKSPYENEQLTLF